MGAEMKYTKNIIPNKLVIIHLCVSTDSLYFNVDGGGSGCGLAILYYLF
jgi:hypothetical protein